MAAVTKVLIHSQGKTEGSLRLAIDHYRPNMVFLISNPDTNAPKFRDWVIAGDAMVGKWSGDVAHCELIEIEPFSESSVLQMINAVKQAKERARELAPKDRFRFYAGVSGGTKLMVIGMALAAIQGDLTAYYVDKPSESERSAGEYVIEIDFMNQLMTATSWLNADSRRLKNLNYLRVIEHGAGSGLESTSKLMIEPRWTAHSPRTRSESRHMRVQDNITKHQGPRQQRHGHLRREESTLLGIDGPWPIHPQHVRRIARFRFVMTWVELDRFVAGTRPFGKNSVRIRMSST